MRRLVLIAVLSAVVLGSSCAGSSHRNDTDSATIWAAEGSVGSTPPYPVAHECRLVSDEIGRPIRVTTESGEVLVGMLRNVECANPAQLTLSLGATGNAESAVVIELASVSEIVVLNDARQPKARLLGSALFAVGLVAIGGALGAFAFD